MKTRRQQSNNSETAEPASSAKATATKAKEISERNEVNIADPNSKTSPSTSSSLYEDLYSKHDSVTKGIIQTLDQITSSTTSDESNTTDNDSLDLQVFQKLTKAVPMHFLSLKETHRTLCLEVDQALQSKVQQKRKEVESQMLMLQNLMYEKSHLQREIVECERGFENVFLLKMAKEELGMMDSTTKDEEEKDGAQNKKGDEEEKSGSQDENSEARDMDNDDDVIINSFLKPPSSSTYSYRNPKSHAYTLSKLHKESTHRGSLQNELTKQSKRKLALMSQLKEQNGFLKGIPNQITKLEEWSMPLQKYFKKQRVNDYLQQQGQKSGKNEDIGIGGSVETMIGSNRRERLRQARDLSGPLYTLFLQFQSFLDAYSYSTSQQTSSSTENDTDKDFSKALNDIHEWKLSIIERNNEESNDESHNESKENDGEMSPTSMDDIVKDAMQLDDRAIQLWIPIPKISFSSSTTGTTAKSSKAKLAYVKLQFDYLPKLELVTVRVLGHTNGNSNTSRDKDATALEKLIRCNSESGSQLWLLHNLFDNDAGMELPNGFAAKLCFEIDEKLEVNKDETIQGGEENFADDKDDTFEIAGEDDILLDYGDSEAVDVSHEETKTNSDIFLNRVRLELIESNNVLKPYKWCQYLAGLQYPTKDKKDSTSYRIDPTTKSLLVKLSRRIRSHATLAAMIKIFTKKELPNPIPLHPAMSINQDATGNNGKYNTRLERWSERVSNDMYKSYNMSFTRKSKTLHARVQIDSRYPAIPPVWSLQPEESKSLKSSKDDTEILYDSTLGELEADVNSLKEISRYINNDVEESYDWILMHQLRVIVYGWDKYQEILENSKGKTSSGNLQRQRKGRDRRPVNAKGLDVYKLGL